MEAAPRPSPQATNRKLGFSLRNGDIGGGDRGRLRRERAVIEVLQAPPTEMQHYPAQVTWPRRQAAHVTAASGMSRGAERRSLGELEMI